MTANMKSKIRQIYALVSFLYILVLGTLAFYFHIKGFDVVSFWPILGGIISYLAPLSVSNYMTTPKDN